MQTSSNSTKAPWALLLVTLSTAVSVLVGRWLWIVLAETTAPWRRGAPLGPDEALLATASALALATLAWLTLGVALEMLARVPGQVGRVAARLSAAVSPLVVRRAATVVLGASLSAALSPGPSMASTGLALAPLVGITASAAPAPGAGEQATQRPDAAATPRGSSLPDPGFAPPPDPGFAPTPSGDRFVADPPTVRPHPDVTTVTSTDRRAAATTPTRDVVVHRGDSLWSIAARHLGREPSDAEIADAWPRWYAANRTVIGSDPDLLLPGQVLTTPEGPQP